MSTTFRLIDNHDDPPDFDRARFYSIPLTERFDTLDAALRAAVLRAYDLATSHEDEISSVDVALHTTAASGMITVASIHVWSDHEPNLLWLPALRAHLKG